MGQKTAESLLLGQMTDLELDTAIRETRERIIHIDGQMHAEQSGLTSREPGWEWRARQAKRHAVADLQFYEAEWHRRRRKTARADKKTIRVAEKRVAAKAHASLTLAVVKEREGAKTARLACQIAAQKDDDRLFVKAAKEILPANMLADIVQRKLELKGDLRQRTHPGTDTVSPEQTASAVAEEATAKLSSSPFLGSVGRTNYPHPERPGLRIVGYLVPEDEAGLSSGLFALEKRERHLEILRAEAARWRQEAVKLGHSGFLLNTPA